MLKDHKGELRAIMSTENDKTMHTLRVIDKIGERPSLVGGVMDVGYTTQQTIDPTPRASQGSIHSWDDEYGDLSKVTCLLFLNRPER